VQQLTTPSNPGRFVLVARHGPAALTGIAQAAALMARADGKADVIEQQVLLRFLRRHDLLRSFGRRACLDAYRTELRRAAPEPEVLETLCRQRSRISAQLIASAAASIAMADGAAHPAEVELLCRLAERLRVLDTCDEVAAVLFRAQ